MSPRENGSEEEPVIRDNRKIDPETGKARESAGDAPEAVPADEGTQTAAPAEGSATDLLAERTADLQRLQAEFSNYRKRVERDRIAVREQAVASVLTELLPVLDDIGRARDHGELTGGFAKVSESLEAAVGKLGLTAYGAKGDPFDPTVHEALLHSYSAEVTEPTCIEILQPGYRINDRILRAARVAVAEPSEEAAAPEETAAGSGESGGPDEN
ncbi:nucleotide exchange factor GrpE [Microbispora sp. GKU 823]|uniref:nucleotide exchange factor GrpE n=1 Tax=Microbispora sp. GKU 823 TaxID=1652100 RepID=UPI0009A2F53F|nr:nucleotide exchange factor GrpE [Microbispora sp. GKU 823]OPG11830.1 nucleotide exchange factor GrpE [Microbispora sp. GKU 823]